MATTPPLELAGSAVRGFSLDALARDLKKGEEFAGSGKTARTLVKGDALTLTLAVARAGTVLQEHSAPAAAAVIVLEGNVLFSVPGTEQRFDLNRGASVAFAPAVAHRVEAKTDCAFLVVLGGRRRGEGTPGAR